VELNLQSLICIHGVYRDLNFQLYGKQLRLENNKVFHARMMDVRIFDRIVGTQIASMLHHILHGSSSSILRGFLPYFLYTRGSKAHQSGVIFCPDRQLFDRGYELPLGAFQHFGVCRRHAVP